jgi:transposase
LRELRNGTLPEVWIPPSELRDQRELLRLRIFLVRMRTRVKNRIHGTLARYNVQIPGADLFGVEARLQLGARLPELPVHSREAVEQELATLDFLEIQIKIGREAVGENHEGKCGSGSAEDAAMRWQNPQHGLDA